MLVISCSKTAVEEQLKSIDDDANRSLHQAQALPTVCICKQFQGGICAHGLPDHFPN